MNPFKNLVVNLHATGPAAVICVWLASVASVGLFGAGPLADRALNVLAIAGGMILLGLAAKA